MNYKSLYFRLKSKLQRLFVKLSGKPDELTEFRLNCERMMREKNYSRRTQLYISSNDELIVAVDDVKIYIDCEEDLFIFNEVMNEKVYGLASKDEFVVIDIGLNIGIASLFFNGMSNVKKIYSFEPVAETYEKCLRNLSLNQNPTKIVHFNFGLGDSDKTQKFLFSSSFKGSVGNRELPDFKIRSSTRLEEVEVEIRDASTVIEGIISEHPDKKIIIKMDCEGGEYEIIPNLKQNGILDKIDLIYLEWHKSDFLSLLDNFENFNCFYSYNSQDTGMIYAMNQRKK